ncbi:MAG: PKD domain-containing protein [Ferruginibacter sp.]|nr:PKD domain-containing protein [Ferruginibacter sp.]
MKQLLSFYFIFLTAFFCSGQTASFTFNTSNGLFCNPTTVNFTQTCTGNPIGYSWVFSNGQTSTAPNPSITFTTGTYTARLTAIFPNEAITTPPQTITINPAITATLTGDRNYICQPGIINFTASSTGGANSYEWAFGDGNTAITSTPTISHNYITYNNFNAVVKAISPTGCFAIANFGVAVQRPTITASATPTSGCIPTVVNFIASANVPSGDNITTYTWNFGDVSPITTTSTGTTTHSYTVVGSYAPIVSIVTANGCTNSLTLPNVAFGTPPTGLTASSDKLVYCGNETPVFTANATNANAYTWNFGDGTITTTPSNTISHRYLTLGTKSVTVTPLFNGCAGTPLNLPAINIVGVITSFSYANSCGAKNTFAFNNTTQGNQSTVVWNFGDLSPNSSVLNPVHTYPPNGTWVTTLTVTDNVTGCSDVTTVTIYTATPTLSNPDVSICKYSNSTFTISNDYNNPSKTYEWHVFGQTIGPNTTNPFTVQATPLGIYNNNFVIIRNGSQYCPDTVYLGNAIEVKGPNISYNMPASICLSDTLRMLNTSVPTPNSANFTTTFWNYGSIATNDTTFQPNPVKYSVAGTYQIKFVAVDINGCRDSLIKLLVVNPLPFLRIIPRSDTLCEGSSLPLIGFHTDNIVWSPSTNLSCTTCDTTMANPTISRQYYATSTNSFGCSVTDTTSINVINDFTATAVQSPVFICLNDSARINVLPPNKVISWLPNTNISSTNTYNPWVFPKQNTIYTATVSDSVGCFTKTIPIQVNINPLPTVDAGPDRYLPYNSSFTLTPTYSSNVSDYQWSPATNLNCATCPNPTGIALDQHSYEILVNSNDGCLARDTINIFVDCKDANIHMPSAFTPNGDNLNDFYYPLTRGIKNIKKFVIYNRAGKLVFSRSNFTPNTKTLGWNGSVNGTKQNMDSYIFILEATCFTGRDVEVKGMFTLIR